MNFMGDNNWLILSLLIIQSATSHRTFPIVLDYFKSRDVTSINAILCENHGVSKIMGNDFLYHITEANRSKMIHSSVISLKSQHYQIGVIFDLGCSHSWKILQMVSGNQLFNSSYLYAMIMGGPVEEHMLESLEPLTIAFDSDVTLFLNNQLYDVYRTAKGGRLITSVIGEWNDEEGLTISLRPPRWDLRGATLKAVTVVKEFKQELVGKKEFYDSNYLTSVDTLARIPCKRHTYVEFLMNFKTDLSITPDWGYYNELTGKFDNESMYSELEHAAAEFGLAESWMFSARVNTAFFAPVTHYMKSCVVFRHPAAGASFTAFARPFAWSTWLVTFLFILIGSFCLNVIKRFNLEDELSSERQYSSSLFQVAGVMCLQGSYISSIKFPTRILSIFLQILALMVYTYYGAEILGYLLSPTPRTITSVEKLVDSHMDLWAENVTFHKKHFKASATEGATKYYNLGIKKYDNDRFIDRMVGLKLVQRGGAALYGVTWSLYENILKYYSSSEICSLHYIELFNLKTAIAVQKQSPYREMYNRAVQRIIESGLNDFEASRWNAQKPACIGTEANPAVKLEATFIALMIYSTGFLSSVILFIIEIKLSRKEIKRIHAVRR